jgi:hypothetical protein
MRQAESGIFSSLMEILFYIKQQLVNRNQNILRLLALLKIKQEELLEKDFEGILKIIANMHEVSRKKSD